MDGEQVWSLQLFEAQPNSVRFRARSLCTECGTRIPATIKVDGKKRNLANRKRCLTCSPFRVKGKIEIPDDRIHLSCLGCGRHGGKWCRSCRTKIRRIRMKTAAVELLGGRCKDCGWSGPIEGFDFHHEGDKDFLVSRANYKAWDRVREELKKCVLLCAVCHRIRHSDRSKALMEEVNRDLSFYR